MKKQLTMTSAMAAALLALPACSGGDEDEVAQADTAVCVNAEGERVDDDYCDNDRYRSHGGSSAFLWYYLGRGSRIPYYGDSIRHQRYAGMGSFSPRAGANYGRAPVSTRVTRSQAVSRGGMGSKSRSYGGGRS